MMYVIIKADPKNTFISKTQFCAKVLFDTFSFKKKYDNH